jgi:hypothetical protein
MIITDECGKLRLILCEHAIVIQERRWRHARELSEACPENVIAGVFGCTGNVGNVFVGNMKMPKGRAGK